MRHVLLAVLPLLVACASSSGSPEDVSVDASEVTVARCPASVALQLGKPTVAKEAPTETFDGQVLGATERARVSAVMTAARARPGISTSLKLARTASGRCFYEGEGASAGETATFRTKNGKDIFQVFLKDGLQMFAFPESYEASGLVFAPNAKVSLMANVGATGPFSDGATISVRIGQASFGPASADAGASPILLAAGADEEILDGPELVSFLVPARDVTGTVTTSFLANCQLEKNEAKSTVDQAQFDLRVDYDLDDGFNGCHIEFDDGAKYRSSVQVGVFIED